MMISELIQNYCQRIGYKGLIKQDLETLKALHFYHSQTIPFENINAFLGLPVPLDFNSLKEKLIYSKRGGYCFEQNLIFQEILETLGFEVTPLAGRVLWERNLQDLPARTHMLLRIKLEDKDYICDVGFGGNNLTTPLLLHSKNVQETTHGFYRVVENENKEFLLEMRVGDSWRTMYLFTLERQYLSDYELANYYISNAPQSRFVQNLTLGRVGENCRYALFNKRLSVHFLDKPSEVLTLKNFDEFFLTLTQLFKINPDDEMILPAIWRKLEALSDGA